MRRNLHGIIFLLAITFITGTFASASAQSTYKYQCKVAAELYSGYVQDGDPLPPIYPDMWMINYELNTYYAPDADKLINRDFNVQKLYKLGSYRIDKKVNDSLMFVFVDSAYGNDQGWQYKFQGHLRLGRQLDHLNHFIYRENKEMLPFSVDLLVNPTVLYAFRPDSSSKEILFLFFSYTPHDNFPKALLSEFGKADQYVKLGFSPFDLKFPAPSQQPRLLFQADPEYPAHLLRMKRSGVVKMMLLVDRDGTIVRAEIIEKAQYSPFDVAAVDAAQKSLFKPAADSLGNAIPAWIPMTVEFDPDKYSQQ